MHLVVFLTAGVSLHQWDRQGALDRELAGYREMIRRGHRVSLVTYGAGEDRDLARRLKPEFTVARNSLGLPRHQYVRLLPLLHARLLRSADVIKCNQVDGGEVALRAARFHRKPMVARSGYPWSKTLAERLPPQAWEIGYARRVEAELAAGCRRWIVTTDAAAAELAAAFPAHAAKVRVVPNGVDTSLFQPRPGVARDVDVLWVGRLEDEKRPQLLLDALALRPRLRAAIIGQGSLAESLRRRYESLGLRVRWVGGVPHADIAGWMARSSAYAITSRYEGHPKSLLEAMSAALPCLGVDVRGIREEITDGDTGWLRLDSPEALASGLDAILSDPVAASARGAAARTRVLARCSRAAVVDQELAILSEAARAP